MFGHQLLGVEITAKEHKAVRDYCRENGMTMKAFVLYYMQGPITTVMNGRDPIAKPPHKPRRRRRAR